MLCPTSSLTETETTNVCCLKPLHLFTEIHNHPRFFPCVWGGSLKTTLRFSDSLGLSELLYSWLQFMTVKTYILKSAVKRRHTGQQLGDTNYPLPVESYGQFLILPAMMCDNVQGLLSTRERPPSLGTQGSQWRSVR